MRHLGRLELTSYHLPAARSDRASTLIPLDHFRRLLIAFPLPPWLARLREYSHTISESCHYSLPVPGPSRRLSVPAFETLSGTWRDRRPIE